MLDSETESEDEMPTKHDLAFIDDQEADTSDTDNEWVRMTFYKGIKTNQTFECENNSSYFY